MKARTIVVALLAAASLTACGALSGPEEGSGRLGTRSLPVGAAFTGIEADGAFRVEVVEAGEASVSAEADDNLLPLLRAEVTDGVLRLSQSRSWFSKNPFVVRVAAPGVSSFAASGAARVVAAGVAGKTVRIVAGGSALVTVTGASLADVLEIRASEASVVEARVDCVDAQINADAAARVSGPKARTARVLASGTASVDLDVAERLRAETTGGSTVLYGGDPQVEGRAGAATTVRPR